MSAAPWVLAATSEAAPARALAAGGADRIVAYHSSAYRRVGLPSVAGLLPWASANEQTLEMLSSVVEGAGGVPVLATVCANDGLRSRGEMIAAVAAAGARGVLNAPTTGLISGDVRGALERAGLGMASEIALVAEAREVGLEAWAYVFDGEWARAAALAGATGLIAHLGITGAANDGSAFDRAIERVRTIVDAAAAFTNLPVVVHGGPLRTPATARRLVAALTAQEAACVRGFFGASVFEGLNRQDTASALQSWRTALASARNTVDGADGDA